VIAAGTAIQALATILPGGDDHPIAYSVAIHLCAQSRDLARDLAPQDVGQWNGQPRQTLPDVDIQMVQRAGPYANQD
jgi:hypothetical protein